MFNSTIEFFSNYWLVLSIACSSIIVLAFKFFDQFKIDTFNAIVINYLTCIIVGLPILFNSEVSLIETHIEEWVPFAILLGAIFIGVFFLIGRTAQTSGVAIASLSMKLGYVMPIILAFLVYKESITNNKIIGIALTIVAIVLVSFPKKQVNTSSKMIFYPFIIFLFSGFADSVVQFVEHKYFFASGADQFTVFLFGTAGLLGLLILLFKQMIGKRKKISIKDMVGGVLLGIPNYGSIYFFIKALNHPNMESSMAFPVNNIGIVLVSSLLAFLLFKEKLSLLNYLGLTIAFLSIVILSL